MPLSIFSYSWRWPGLVCSYLEGGGVALAKICECQSVMLYTLGGYWLGEVFGEYVYRVTKTRVSCIWCCHFLLPFWKGFPHTCALGRFSGRGWKLIYYEQFPKIPILRSGVYVCGVGPGSPPPLYTCIFMVSGSWWRGREGRSQEVYLMLFENEVFAIIARVQLKNAKHASFESYLI